MRRAAGFGVLVALVLALAIFAILSPARRATTFPVPPGTEQTFSADQLVPGDRFTCHGFAVDVQSPGFGYVASDGLRAGTALDGSVTITCPDELEPL
jgi:hypothetical protein